MLHPPFAFWGLFLFFGTQGNIYPGLIIALASMLWSQRSRGREVWGSTVWETEVHQFQATLAPGEQAARAGEVQLWQSCLHPGQCSLCIAEDLCDFSQKTFLQEVGIQLDSVPCSLQKLCACVRNASFVLFPILPSNAAMCPSPDLSVLSINFH